MKLTIVAASCGPACPGGHASAAGRAAGMATRAIRSATQLAMAVTAPPLIRCR